MNNDKNMEVVDWHDWPRPLVARRPSPRSVISPTMIGLVGTVLVHALIVPSAYMGSRAAKSRPPKVQEAGALTNSTGDEESALVLIGLPTVAKSSQETAQSVAPSLPELAKMKVKSPIDLEPASLLNLEVLTLGEAESSSATAANGDGAEQARLFGIYTGQIQARIDRIWRRPRTAIGDAGSASNSDDSFQCEAQIVQDAHGNVQEILLPRCNGSLAWRLSLVSAIQEASPLPAPPNASVFSRSIALNFVGIAYSAGSSSGEYETATPPLGRAGESVEQGAIIKTGQPLQATKTSGPAAVVTTPDSRN